MVIKKVYGSGSMVRFSFVIGVLKFIILGIVILFRVGFVYFFFRYILVGDIYFRVG